MKGQGSGCLAMVIAAVSLCAQQTPPDVAKIIQESARIAKADRKANADYDYSETDLQPDGSKRTFAVHMLFGSPYRELITVNGQPLPADKRNQEKSKLEKEIERRKRESPADRAKRVAQFQKEQNRDLRFLEEFLHAFNFKLLGDEQLGQHRVYVIEATPRPGYKPRDKETAALTGMRG